MSLSPFDFSADSMKGMYSWFIDILNHLSYNNYRNGLWNPNISGLTGSPTITARYQRFGKFCDINILIDGTHSVSSATVSLPEDNISYGISKVYNLTDGVEIGIGVINSEALYLPDYSVTGKKVIIQGNYPLKGV